MWKSALDVCNHEISVLPAFERAANDIFHAIFPQDFTLMRGIVSGIKIFDGKGAPLDFFPRSSPLKCVTSRPDYAGNSGHVGVARVLGVIAAVSIDGFD